MPNFQSGQMKLTVTSVCATLLGGMFLPVSASVASTEAVHQQVTLPAIMMAKVWHEGQDVSSFLVSEKLDGVRACWDGQHLRFRSGRPIVAPDWFIKGLPKTALDGELWLGRGRFDALSKTVRKAIPVHAEWRELRYMIFDLPGATGSFAERARHILTVVEQAHQPWLQAVAQQRVANSAALQALLKQVVQNGGEGLMLHRANALWSPGRSDALQKLKPIPDEDARVVAHLPGKGRHLGRLGALLLALPNGQRFALGTGFTDEQRSNPPPIGTIVTYRYRDRTSKGLPRFASFLRERAQE